MQASPIGSRGSCETSFFEGCEIKTTEHGVGMHARCVWVLNRASAIGGSGILHAVATRLKGQPNGQPCWWCLNQSHLRDFRDSISDGIISELGRVQELCESRGGRHGLPI